jgi:hypothetical protein
MAAPRGNLFAIGNTGGRPPLFTNHEDLASKIAAYLDWEDENRGNDAKGVGKGLYTISGCALFLGFASRQSFYDLEKRDEFSYIMQRFKLFMTHWNEQKLYYMGTFPGSKLWLTNFAGYTEETTQTVRNITEEKPEVVMTDAPKFASRESEVDGL